MNPHDNRSGQAQVAGRHRVMIIIWFAILLSAGSFFLIALLVGQTSAAGDEAGARNSDMMFWILLALSVSTLGISFLFKSRLYAQAVAQQRVELVVFGFIMALALCEAGVLFGLVFYLHSGGEPRAFLIMLVGALGIALHMPRQAALLDASYKGQV